jgi:hypothetical protein
LVYGEGVAFDEVELALLAAGFRNADGSERWYCWQGTGNGLVYAWRLLSSPPAVLRDRALEGLRARMVAYERVLAETRSADQALAAAEALET